MRRCRMAWDDAGCHGFEVSLLRVQCGGTSGGTIRFPNARTPSEIKILGRHFESRQPPGNSGRCPSSGPSSQGEGPLSLECHLARTLSPAGCASESKRRAFDGALGSDHCVGGSTLPRRVSKPGPPQNRPPRMGTMKRSPCGPAPSDSRWSMSISAVQARRARGGGVDRLSAKATRWARSSRGYSFEALIEGVRGNVEASPRLCCRAGTWCAGRLKKACGRNGLGGR
jgi:hypothetical protein